MTTIRPTSIPEFPTPQKRILSAWIVNDTDAMYLEQVGSFQGTAGDDDFVFSSTPMEKGIGGRLIEPGFKDERDFRNRALVLCYTSRHGDLMQMALRAWESYQPLIRSASHCYTAP